MSTRLSHISDAQWRTFVADLAEALELREGDRVFEVQCGTGPLLLPLYEAGCVVGGCDPDAAAIDRAKRDMPGGEWSVADVETVDLSTPWDVVMACSVLDASWGADAAGNLLEKMVRNASTAVAILLVPAGLPLDARWFLRALSALGVASVRLPALRSIDQGESSPPHFNVIARLR